MLITGKQLIKTRIVIKNITLPIALSLYLNHNKSIFILFEEIISSQELVQIDNIKLTSYIRVSQLILNYHDIVKYTMARKIRRTIKT